MCLENAYFLYLKKNNTQLSNGTASQKAYIDIV